MGVLKVRTSDGSFVPVQYGVAYATDAETIAGTEVAKAVTPASLKYERPYIDVHTHGAKGDGSVDDAPAVRAAAAAALAGGKALFFPAGTYKFSTTEASKQSICPLTAGLHIFGVPGRSFIQMDPALTGWRTIFGSIPWDTFDMSGFLVEDLIFLCGNLTDAANATSQRYAISAFNGTGMRVSRCEFRNWDSRNIIMLATNVVDTSKVVDDVTVDHCNFINIGGTYWHDHSALYLAARNVYAHHNNFVGNTTPASNAWTAIETHGHRIDVHDNTIANYCSPCLLCARNATTEPGVGPPANYQYHNNTVYNCATGVTIRPLDDMSDIDIHDNTIAIGIDQWPLAAATPYPGTDMRAGVTMYGQATGVARVNIHHNICRWLAYTGTASPYDAFVIWRRPQRIAGTDVDVDVSICDNTVIDCPSAGVHVENFAQLARWNVNRNSFVNVGKAKLGTALQVGVMLGFQAWTGTRPTGVIDSRFNGNQFIDDQGAHSLAAVLYSPPGAVRTDATGATNGTTTVSGASLVTDIGSLISGTNIPAGAYVTQISGSSDGYSGTGYVISAAATGTGSGITLTLTKQHPLFNNVELFDINKRIADGAVVPDSTLQTGQTVTTRGFTPRIVFKTGDQSYSDNVNLTDVTDLGFPVEANAVYAFEFFIMSNATAATNGLCVAVNGPAAPTFLHWAELAAISGAAMNAGGSLAYNTALVNTASSTVAGGCPTFLQGFLHNGANAGTLQLRFRCEEATSLTVQRGSWGRLTRLQ